MQKKIKVGASTPLPNEIPASVRRDLRINRTWLAKHRSTVKLLVCPKFQQRARFVGLVSGASHDHQATRITGLR